MCIPDNEGTPYLAAPVINVDETCTDKRGANSGVDHNLGLIPPMALASNDFGADMWAEFGILTREPRFAVVKFHQSLGSEDRVEVVIVFEIANLCRGLR